MLLGLGLGVNRGRANVEAGPPAPTGITLVGQITHDVVSGTVGGSYALPAGTQSGDFIRIFMACDNNSGIGPTTSGYLTRFDNDVSAPKAVVFYKFAGASETLNLTGDGSKDTAVVIEVHRGVDPASPFDIASPLSNDGLGSNPSPPNVTTVTDGALVSISGFMDDDVITSVSDQSFGNLAFISVGPSNGAATTMVASAVSETAGTVNPPSFLTNGDDAWWALTDALRPAT